jgi:hypothetical protein
MWRFLILALGVAVPSGAQAPVAVDHASDRLRSWARDVTLDDAVGGELARFGGSPSRLGEAFTRTFAAALHRDVLGQVVTAVEEIERVGCRPAITVAIPAPVAGVSSASGAERDFLGSVVRTVSVACYSSAHTPIATLDLFTSAPFRQEAEPRIRRIWTEDGLQCVATEGVRVLMAPTTACNRLQRLASESVAAEHSQVVRNPEVRGQQSIYFKASVKAFVGTPDGLAFVYVNVTRGADLSRASRWVAERKVAESQRAQVEALRRRLKETRSAP